VSRSFCVSALSVVCVCVFFLLNYNISGIILKTTDTIGITFIPELPYLS
jgi:hypothetical protein